MFEVFFWFRGQCKTGGNDIPTSAVAVRFFAVSQTLFSNSISYPRSNTPIPDAFSTACADDPCEVYECCESFWAYHACPDGSVPVDDADIIECPDSGCTDDFCCQACEYRFNFLEPLGCVKGEE